MDQSNSPNNLPNQPIYDPNQTYSKQPNYGPSFQPSEPEDPLYQDPQQPVSKVKKSPLKKILMFLIFVLILGGVGGGIFYVVQNNPTLLDSLKGGDQVSNKGVTEDQSEDLTEETETDLEVEEDPLLTTETQASPSAEPKTTFEFFDTTVWLNPSLDWSKVVGQEILLSDQVLAVESETIQFTTLQLQGSEWATTYTSKNPPKFTESTRQKENRLSSLGWEKELELEDGTLFSVLDVRNSEKYVNAYIREQGNKIQVYGELELISEATESSDIIETEKRIFLTEPLDINPILQPLL